jgi:hypothetical protein
MTGLLNIFQAVKSQLTQISICHVDAAQAVYKRVPVYIPQGWEAQAKERFAGRPMQKILDENACRHVPGV